MVLRAWCLTQVEHAKPLAQRESVAVVQWLNRVHRALKVTLGALKQIVRHILLIFFERLPHLVQAQERGHLARQVHTARKDPLTSLQ